MEGGINRFQVNINIKIKQVKILIFGDWNTIDVFYLSGWEKQKSKHKMINLERSTYHLLISGFFLYYAIYERYH